MQRRPRRPPGALPVQLRRRLRRHVHRPGPARLLHPRRCRVQQHIPGLRAAEAIAHSHQLLARPLGRDCFIRAAAQ